MIWQGFKHWRVKRILKRYPISHALWHSLMAEDQLFSGLSSVQKAYLRELATLFIHQKRFRAAQGLVLTEAMQVKIAAHACLLILELDLDCYQGWRDIIVYPQAFVVERDETDALGVVSHQPRVLGGEAWLHGPVVLEWQSFEEESRKFELGRNLVLHEFSHKLDMLNGVANGMPPLHSTMDHQAWTQAFSQAFQKLQHQIEHQDHANMNPYGATDPAEFFAVSTEYFFTAPRHLNQHFPAVYQQLCLFYRQEPNP